MFWPVFSRKPNAPHRPTQFKAAFRPRLEALEERLALYAASGYEWANPNVSASIMLDGTPTDGGLPSNLVAKLNQIAPTATWQREFARALQTWASVTPLNFHFVADSGAAAGISGSTQGDSRFGDIRLGGYASDLWSGYTYFPAGGTLGGDVFVNTVVAWHIGANPDLYSILLHETGHALGLDHTAIYPAVMRPSISTVYTGLLADDIAGIQSLYGARQEDAYDGGAGNDSFTSATNMALSGAGGAALSADLTTDGDVDYFRVTAPAAFDGTLSVSLDARNVSLLQGKISVYDAAFNLVGTAAANSYGSVATVNLSGLVGGQSYYLVADGASSDVFGLGKFQLTAQFGGVDVPPPPPPPPAVPSLSVNNVSVVEGNSGTKALAFTVSLSAASTSPVTVQYATADSSATAGSDYAAVGGTLTFVAGQTQQTITVAVNGDTVAEANEAFFVNLSSPTNATLAAGQGIGTITNDDVAVDRYEANNTAGAATNFGRTANINQSSLTLHTATDGDYYRFTASKKALYNVTITPTQGSGTLNLAVLNGSQAVLRSGQSASGAIRLSVSLAAGQTYYIKANSSTGGQFGYNLSVAKSVGGAAQLGPNATSGLAWAAAHDFVLSEITAKGSLWPTASRPASAPQPLSSSVGQAFLPAVTNSNSAVISDKHESPPTSRADQASPSEDDLFWVYGE